MPQSKPEWTADIEVSAELAATWIAARFPDLAHHPVIQVGWGFDNAVYRVGPELVFRIPRRKMGAELLDLEIGVLPHLADHVPVPIPVPVRIGEPGPDFPYRFAAYGWLEGTTAGRFDPTEAQRAALAPILGRTLKALHGAEAGPEAEAADPGDILYRHDLVRRLPKLLGLLDDLPTEVGGVRDTLQDLVATEPWDGRPHWVHGDLYPRHLLLGDDAALVGIIDWGDCHRGDPAIDLAIAWTFLPTEAFGTFREAYGPISDAQWNRARFRALHYGIHLLRFGLTEDDEAMARMGRRALATARR